MQSVQSLSHGKRENLPFTFSDVVERGLWMPGDGADQGPESPTPVHAAGVSAQEKRDSVLLQLIYYSSSLVLQNQRLCHTHPEALLTWAV